MNSPEPNQTFIEGKKYIAIESFNGGLPTHDFLKDEVYLYCGCNYDRYDGAYLLGFENINSKEKNIWWWYDNEPRIKYFIPLKTDALIEVKNLLESIQQISLRYRVTEETLKAFNLLGKMYVSLNPDERSEVQKNLNDSQGKKIIGFSVIAAEKAINEKNSDWIKSAITLHIIENFRFDYRENIRLITLLNHAAARIGISIENIFDGLSYLASPLALDYFRKYLSDNQPLNRILSFGIHEVEENGVIKLKVIP